MVHHDRKAARRGRKSSRAVREGLFSVVVACSMAAVWPAIAQAPASPAPGSPAPGSPAPEVTPAGQPEEPVLLSANQVTFDEDLGIVTASGNVEMSQGLRTVRADVITYNQRTKVVTATGNVRLVEPSGDILFADYAELTDDMRDAFIENIRILMTDNSRVAGVEGERRGGRMTRMNRGVYSPCELCKTDPTEPPLWQIKASRIVHDNEAKDVRYRDATLEMFGVPVFYTPYLSHPDPTVERRSGFLTPLYGNSSDLGFFVRGYYYIDIAPDQDATLEVSPSSKQGLMLGGEYRKRFENGRLQLNGSVTRSDIKRKYGDVEVVDQDRWRGYLFAEGLFDINDVWRWGFDVKRASDDLFLRRYYGFREDYLTSRAFVEGFRGRNYAAINAYAFQDLRYGDTTEEPLVVPQARYTALGDPGSFLGGRLSLDTGVLALHRNTGRDTRRFSFEPGWEREFVSSVGFVTTVSGRVLVEAYNVANDSYLVSSGYSSSDSTSSYRLFPQAQATVRYPFARYGESSEQIIEPIVSLTTAPQVSNDPRYPNEDSLDVEFDETNLFALNRFSGIDRLEGGSRVTYGVRSGIYGYQLGSASLFLGQSYRFSEQTAFGPGTGLEDRRSDYVGRVDLRPGSFIDLSYSFRLDQEDLVARRHAVTGLAYYGPVALGTSYIYSDQTRNTNLVGSNNEVEQITLSASVRLSSQWNLSLAHLQSFTPNPGPRTSLAVLQYQDECFLFQTIARRDFTETAGEEDGNTILFRLVFKNIGEFKSPSFSANFSGGSTTPGQ